MEYNYDKLPKELKAKLSRRARPNERRDNILQVLQEYKRPLTVDEILIGLYQKKLDVPTRVQVRAVVDDLKQSAIVTTEGERQRMRVILTSSTYAPESELEVA